MQDVDIARMRGLLLIEFIENAGIIQIKKKNMEI
jgi:hypothetical protein